MEFEDDVHYAETKYYVDEEEEFARRLADLANEEETVADTEQASAEGSGTGGAAEEDTSPGDQHRDNKGVGEDEGCSEFTIPPEVRDMLEEKWEAWKNTTKAEQKKCWKELASRLRTMDIHQTLEKLVWILRQAVHHYFDETSD